MTGSATRKPRLLCGSKGRNEKRMSAFPGSPSLWAGSFTEKGFTITLDILFGLNKIRNAISQYETMKLSMRGTKPSRLDHSFKKGGGLI